MAPEQSAHRAPADPRSDVYSLGVVLYELLTGRRPFDRRDCILSLLREIAEQPPPAPRALDPTLPRVLETICLKALEKAPQDRFDTAGEQGDELRRWLNDEPSRIQRPGPLQVARRWARRNRLVAWTATAATVVVACAAVFAVWKHEQARFHAQAEAQIQVAALHDAVRQRLRDPTYGRRAEALDLLKQAKRHRRLLPWGEATEQLDLQSRSLFAWTLATPEFLTTQLAELKGVGHRSWPVAIHPDGRSLAVGTNVRPILWRRGEDLKLPDGLTNPLPGSRLVFHTDGRFLLCAPDAGGMETWDAEVTRIVGQWRQEQAAGVLAFGMPSDSPAVMACTTEGVVHVLSLPTLEENAQWPVEQSTTRWTAAAFTEQSTHVAWGNAQGQVQVNSADGRLVRKIKADATQIETLAWSPDSRLVAVGSRGGVVRLWDVETGQPSSPLFVGTTGVGSIVFSRDGRRLVAGARHMQTKVWDVPTGRQLMSGPGPTSLTFSHDGRLLATGGKDFVAFCELSPAEIIRELSGHDRIVQQVVWSADSTRLATIDTGFQIHVWNLESPQPIWSKVAPSEGLHAHRSNAGLAFSDDGRLLAYASGGINISHLFVCDLSTGEQLWHGDLPGGYEHLIGIGKDEFLLAREEHDQAGHVWNSALYRWQAGQPPERLKILRRGQPGEDGFFDGELTRDGRLFVWAGPRQPSSKQRLEIWDLATGQVERLWRATNNSDAETNFCMSDDASFLHVKTGNDDQRILDLRTGTHQTVRGGPIAIAPGGRWLLTYHALDVHLCPHNQEARPWIQFKALGSDHEGHGSDELIISGLAVNFSPDGQYLAWGNNSGFVRVANLPALKRGIEELERKISP